jgi:hypothetical protein
MARFDLDPFDVWWFFRILREKTTLIQKAKSGDTRAIEYILDRMGGKALQSVELCGSVAQHVITEVVKTKTKASLTKIRAMTTPREPVPYFVPTLSRKP